MQTLKVRKNVEIRYDRYGYLESTVYTTGIRNAASTAHGCEMDVDT